MVGAVPSAGFDPLEPDSLRSQFLLHREDLIDQIRNWAIQAKGEPHDLRDCCVGGLASFKAAEKACGEATGVAQLRP